MQIAVSIRISARSIAAIAGIWQKMAKVPRKEGDCTRWRGLRKSHMHQANKRSVLAFLLCVHIRVVCAVLYVRLDAVRRVVQFPPCMLDVRIISLVA